MECIKDLDDTWRNVVVCRNRGLSRSRVLWKPLWRTYVYQRTQKIKRSIKCKCRAGRVRTVELTRADSVCAYSICFTVISTLLTTCVINYSRRFTCSLTVLADFTVWRGYFVDKHFSGLDAKHSLQHTYSYLLIEWICEVVESVSYYYNPLFYSYRISCTSLAGWHHYCNLS